MQPLRPLTTAIGFGIFAMLTAAHAAEPVTWMLDSTSRIAGHETTVLGSPRVERTGARAAVCFDGRDDGLILQTNPIAGWERFTIEVLMRPEGDAPDEQRFFHIEDDRAHRLLLETRLPQERRWALDAFLYNHKDEKRALFDRERVHATDRWHWVALSVDGETMTSYVNGAKELEGAFPFQSMSSGRMSLGVRLNERSWYQGCLAEVRFTPEALSASKLQKTLPE